MKSFPISQITAQVIVQILKKETTYAGVLAHKKDNESCQIKRSVGVGISMEERHEIKKTSKFLITLH